MKEIGDASYWHMQMNLPAKVIRQSQIDKWKRPDYGDEIVEVLDVSPQYDEPIGPQTRLESLGIVMPSIVIDPLINKRLARSGTELTFSPLFLEEGLIEAEIEEPIRVEVIPSQAKDVGMVMNGNKGALDPFVRLDLGHRCKDLCHASSELNHYFWLGILASSSLASSESRYAISDTRQKRIERADWKVIGSLLGVTANSMPAYLSDRPNTAGVFAGLLLVSALYKSRSSIKKTSLEDIANKLHRDKAEELAKKHPVFVIDAKE